MIDINGLQLMNRSEFFFFSLLYEIFVCGAFLYWYIFSHQTWSNLILSLLSRAMRLLNQLWPETLSVGKKRPHSVLCLKVMQGEFDLLGRKAALVVRWVSQLHLKPTVTVRSRCDPWSAAQSPSHPLIQRKRGAGWIAVTRSVAED